MRLFIAEKPSIARAIADNLPGQKTRRDGYIQAGEDVVTWCIGHLMELQDPDEYDEAFKQWSLERLPIFPETLKFRPKNDPGLKKQISVIKSFLDRAYVVINAGDNDREGHLLVMLVLEHLKCKSKVQRLLISSPDNVSVKKALADLRPNDEYATLLESGKARAFADWLVGMNLSRAFTKAFGRDGSDRLVTVGRVQTPTLAMVVERDLLIENFVSKDFYVPVVKLDKDGQSFYARWIKVGDRGFDEEGRLVDLEIAKRAVVPKRYDTMQVESVEKEQKKENPPTLFRLATLTAACSVRLGMTADQTLEVAQALYEKHRLTTYPRTDCSYLPDAHHAEAPEVFASIKGAYPDVEGLIERADFSLKTSSFNDSKVSAHHAIIPSRATPEAIAALTERERAVYDMIVRRYLSHFYPPHIYDQTIIIAVDPDGRRYQATGKVTVSKGWLVVEQADVDEDKGEDEEGQAGLPAVSEGEDLKILERGLEQKKTSPPKRYTDATLILDMENVHRVVERRMKHAGEAALERLKPLIARLKEVAGIGTDATRANLVKGLVDKGYLERKKRQIVSTPLGREVIRNVPDKIKSPIMTALFEQVLDSIVKGDMTTDRFLGEQRKWIQDAIEHARNTKMVVTPYKREQRAGGAPKKAGKPAAAPEGAKKCPNCASGHLVKRERKGKPGEFFLGCNQFPTCKTIENMSKPSEAA